MILALQPWVFPNTPPVGNERVLARQLIYNHRMSPAIRKFFSYWIDHHYLNWKYLDMSHDIELTDDQLPEGPLPIWIEVPNQRVTQLDTLLRVSQLHGILDTSVTVMYPFNESDQDAKKFCLDMDWKYEDAFSMYGVEDQTIILLDPYIDDIDRSRRDPDEIGIILPEYISRARRKLIIVTAVDNAQRCELNTVLDLV